MLSRGTIPIALVKAKNDLQYIVMCSKIRKIIHVIGKRIFLGNRSIWLRKLAMFNSYNSFVNLLLLQVFEIQTFIANKLLTKQLK